MGNTYDEARSSYLQEIRMKICDEVVDNLIDDIIMAIGFEVHRLHAVGAFLDEPEEGEKTYEIVHAEGRDVFGNDLNNINIPLCKCFHCNAEMVASTFARHFNNCKTRRNIAKVPTVVTPDSEKDSQEVSDSFDDDDKDDVKDLDYGSRRQSKKKTIKPKKTRRGRGKKK